MLFRSPDALKGKSDPAYVDLIEKAELVEIYDDYVNYSTEYSDRPNGANISLASDAETLYSIGFAEVKLLVTPEVATKKAAVDFYLSGVCCYYFTPCIVLKVGFRLSTDLPEPSGEKYDDDVISASVRASSWATKIDKNLAAKAKVVIPKVASQEE